METRNKKKKQIDMSVVKIQQGMIELLLLLQGLGASQIRGLINFVNPNVTVDLLIDTLIQLIKKASIKQLERWLVKAVPQSFDNPEEPDPDKKDDEHNKQVQFTVLYLVYQLQTLFKTLSLNQLMKLFEILSLVQPNVSSTDHHSRVLQQLQQLLSQVEPEAMTGLHEEISQSSPGTEMSKLNSLVPLERQDFHLYQPLLGLLQLELQDLLDLQKKLPKLEYVHLFLLLKLFLEGSYNMLDYRDLLLPKEKANGNHQKSKDAEGFISDEQLLELGISNSEQADGNNQRRLQLEIVEQPPEKCVYKRNIKPTPTVMIIGDNTNIDGNIYVVPTLIRCDTFEEETKLITGNRPVRVTSGRVIPFKRLKILCTSHQLKETLLSLRFELRKYGQGNEYEVIHSVTSNPICVLSHSTQLKPAAHSKPVVQEVIPCSGPPSGFTRVAVLGANFVDSPTTRVKFDQTEVMPIFHGSKTLICHTPRHIPGTVSVLVCNDAKRWSESSGTFTYDEQIPEEEGKVATSIDTQFNLNIANSICEAAFEGGYETLREIQEKDSSQLHKSDQRGYSPIHYSAAAGQTLVTTWLLQELAVNPNSRDKLGNTPLHHAVKQGKLEDVMILCQQQANPNAQNNEAVSPLHIAALEGHQEIVRVLLQFGAKTETQLLDGSTALHIATSLGFKEIMNTLLQSGAFVNAKDEEGDTPLFWAIRSNDSTLTRMLLNAGASVRCVNDDLENVVHLASYFCSPEIVQLLLNRFTGRQRTSGVDRPDGVGLTPLLCSCYNRNSTVTDLLVQDGDLNVRSEGISAFDLCRMIGNGKGFSALLKSKRERSLGGAISKIRLGTKCGRSTLSKKKSRESGARYSNLMNLGITSLLTKF